MSEALNSYDDGQDYIARYAFDLSSNRMTKETDNAATSTAISAFLASGTFSGDETISYEAARKNGQGSIRLLHRDGLDLSPEWVSEG